jgi:hypothetical protein
MPARHLPSPRLYQPQRALNAMCERGWALVRLRPGTKQAFERGWNKVSRAPSDFQPGENVGVRFGPDSGNLVDIDLDIPEARLLVGEPVFGLDKQPEFGRASLPAGHRGHRLLVSPDSPGRSRPFCFRSEEDKAILRAHGIDRLTVLEIRASGQTAVPPSVITREVEGRVVPDSLVWSQPGAAQVAIPEMAWEEVQRRAGRLAVSAFATAVMRGIDSDPTALNSAHRQFRELLVEAGCRDAEDIDAAVMRALATGTPQPSNRGADPSNLFDAQSRIGDTLRRWLGHEGNAAQHHDAPVPDHGPITAEDLETLLDVLDPCNFASYFAWRDLMFACHHATGGSDAGREVFVKWSQGNPAYYGGDWTRKVRNAWRTCSTERAGAITLGTLLKCIDQAGHRSLRLQVMSRYGPPAANDFDDALLDDYERIAAAPIIPFDEAKLNAPIIDKEGH